MPVKCIVSERLKGQRIPRIAEENSAEEAICRIPVGVPRMASFDIQAAYHFTDAEFDLDLYATFYNYTDGGGYTVEHECAYNTNVNARNFSWVSWIESVTEHEGSRIWVCDHPVHLLCNDLDPEFKRPGIPVFIVPSAQKVPFNSFHQQLDEYKYEYKFIPPADHSFEPPDISWEPPSFDAPSWDIPSFEPPIFDMDVPNFIPPEEPWLSMEPPEIPSWMLEQPDYWDNVPPWILNPDIANGGGGSIDRVADCGSVQVRGDSCIVISEKITYDSTANFAVESCTFNVQEDDSCLGSYLCRLFQMGANSAPIGDRTVIVNCTGDGLEFRINPELFTNKNCTTLQTKADNSKIWFVPLVEDIVQMFYNAGASSGLITTEVEKNTDCHVMTFKLNNLEDGILIANGAAMRTYAGPSGADPDKHYVVKGEGSGLTAEEQTDSDCSECEKKEKEKAAKAEATPK